MQLFFSLCDVADICNGNKLDARPMIIFWRIVRYIFDLISRFIWRTKALAEDSETEVYTKSNLETCDDFQSETSGNKEYGCIKTSETIYEKEKADYEERKTISEPEFLKKNNSDDNVLKKRTSLGTNKITPPEVTDYNSKKAAADIMMKRNYVRRNSKRFVIGDGEDDETIPEMPDIKITETEDDEIPSNWTKETTYGRLAVKSSLT